MELYQIEPIHFPTLTRYYFHWLYVYVVHFYVHACVVNCLLMYFYSVLILDFVNTMVSDFCPSWIRDLELLRMPGSAMAWRLYLPGCWHNLSMFLCANRIMYVYIVLLLLFVR